jgi:hypothetical protein
MTVSMLLMTGCAERLRYDASKVSSVVIIDGDRARVDTKTYVPTVVYSRMSIQLIVAEINRSKFLGGEGFVITSKPIRSVVLLGSDGNEQSYRVLYEGREAIAEGKTWLVSPNLFATIDEAIGRRPQ